MYGVFLLNSYEDIEKLLFGDEAVAPLEESCLACIQSLEFDSQHPMKLGVVATLDVLALGKWQQADQEFKVIFEHGKLKASLEYKEPCIANKTKHPNQNSDFHLHWLFSRYLHEFCSLYRDCWLCASSRPGHKYTGKQGLVLELGEQMFATGVAIFVEFCA